MNVNSITDKFSDLSFQNHDNPNFNIDSEVRIIEHKKIATAFKARGALTATECTFERGVETLGRIQFFKVTASEKVESCGSSVQAFDSQLSEVCANTHMQLKDTIAKIVTLNYGTSAKLVWNNSELMKLPAESVKASSDIKLTNIVCKNVISYFGTLQAEQCSLDTINVRRKIELIKTSAGNVTLGIYNGVPSTITLNDSIIKGDLIISQATQTLGDCMIKGGRSMEISGKTFKFDFKDLSRIPGILQQICVPEGAEGSINGELYCCKEGFLIPKDPNSKSVKFNNELNVTIVGGTILGKIIYKDGCNVKLTLKDVKVASDPKSKLESDAKVDAEMDLAVE